MGAASAVLRMGRSPAADGQGSGAGGTGPPWQGLCGVESVIPVQASEPGASDEVVMSLAY